MKYDWPVSSVMDLFYTPGRLTPIPLCYQEIGRVRKYFPQPSVVSINLTGEVTIGETIAVATDIGFQQESVTSLEDNGQAIKKAVAGQNVGAKTDMPKEVFRVDVPVYRVIPSSAGEAR
jgi:hypothetical protein